MSLLAQQHAETSHAYSDIVSLHLVELQQAKYLGRKTILCPVISNNSLLSRASPGLRLTPSFNPASLIFQ